MSFLASWRTALRVARREARRAKGRSSLVIAMIALPVMFLTFAAVTYDMLTLNGAERADRTMGTAEARIRWTSTTPKLQRPDPYDGIGYTLAQPSGGPPTPDEITKGTLDELLAVLPPGSTAIPLRRGTVRMTTVDGIGQPNVVGVDATNPLTRGYLSIVEGRAPVAATEVALTKEAMVRLGATVGGTVHDADRSRSYTVVGQVEFPSLLREVLLFSPAALPEAPTTDTKTDSNDSAFQIDNAEWLVHTPSPVSWADVMRYNQSGLIVASRAVLNDPPPESEVPLSRYGVLAGVAPRELSVAVIVAGLALLEIILLAGPAFAVSARRRQRQLALVAANGGTPAHVRRIVLADGVVLGFAGALLGIVVGIGVAFASRPIVEDQLAHFRAGGYRVFPVALAIIAVLAVVTGVLAALVPAFVVARQNVISALAGRRGIAKSRKRWIALGLVMTAAGAGIVMYGTLNISATVILAGLVVGELGLVLCTPAIVGLIARIGRILPLTPRIALRDAARNRAAAAPAISAVMAAVAGSMALGLYLDSSRTQEAEAYFSSIPVNVLSASLNDGDPDHPHSAATIESTLRSSVPIAELRTLGDVTCAAGSAANRFCQLIPVPVPELACPQLTIMETERRQLTRAEQAAARLDPRCDTRRIQSNSTVMVDDGTALGIFTGATGADLANAQATLRSGGIVVRNPSLIKDGRVTVSAEIYGVPERATADGATVATPVQAGQKEPEKVTLTLPGYLLTTGTVGTSIASPQAVAKAGFATRPGQLIATTTRPLTQADEDKLRAVLAPLQAYAYVEHGPSDTTDVRFYLLIAAAIAITIGAAAVGTGLAAADGRADLSTLAAVGAPPRVRRGLSLSQSGVIAGLGSLLGVIAGTGAAVAVIEAGNLRYRDLWPGYGPTPIVIPWTILLVVLVITPLVAIAGAGLLTRSRLPIERRI